MASAAHRSGWVGWLTLFLLVPAVEARQQGASDAAAEERRFRIGFEAKAHFRDSDALRLPSPFPFRPEQLPPGQANAFLETVNAGQHFEVSNLSLLVDASWSESLTAHAKIDFVRLYDRNPTSTDRQVELDEAWLRFGHESPPAVAAERIGAYLKVGKFGKFERQDDRHLESYGLLATAFNRFEDVGVELGVELRNVYLKGALSQGNPIFFRDPNALAGDNGTPVLRQPNPDPQLKTGFPIVYDAEVEGLDADGDLELGLGLGVRFGGELARTRADLLAWRYQRPLADTVELDGTFYGGDLDLLRGPFNQFSLPLRGDDKKEVGGNLWLYSGGFSFFGQYVDQELAGMDRTGFEAEAAWTLELPLRFAVGGQQLFTFIQPAVRFSHLKPEFEGGSPLFPAPSVRWEWDKLDLGVRLGLTAGVDVTVEWSDNTFVVRGVDQQMSELLVTLHWRRR